MREFVVGQQYMIRRDLYAIEEWEDDTDCGDIDSVTFKEKLIAGPFTVDDVSPDTDNAHVVIDDEAFWVSPDWVDWDWKPVPKTLTCRKDIDDLYT